MIKRYWLELTRSLGWSDDSIPPLFAIIETRYGEAARRYHNISHLEHLFSLFEEQRGNIADPSAVIAAIFFHDIVYDATARNNEKNSAHLAKNLLNLLCASDDFTARVMQLIMYTETHDAPPDDHDAQLFLDMDMAILGAPPDQYRAYAAAVREEYRHFDDLAYAKGRLELFLKPTLSKPRIFLTDTMHQKFEAQARANLTEEKRQLEARLRFNSPQP